MKAKRASVVSIICVNTASIAMSSSHHHLAVSVRAARRARTPTKTITSARRQRARERVQERRHGEHALVEPAGARRCAKGWCA
jgi:hypothetical protein